MAADDDKRAAVGFSVTLSGQLIAASMATLAVEGAFVWYALGSRQPNAAFIVCAALAAILIVVSIISAGKGITKARNAGFVGSWDLAKGRKEFNVQAILLIGALVSLGVMFSLSGPSKEPAVEQKVESLRTEMAVMQKELETQPALREAAKNEMAAQLTKISLEIQDLRAHLPRSKNQRCQNEQVVPSTLGGPVGTEESHHRLPPSRPCRKSGKH